MRFLNGQAREIARQCVEEPLKKQSLTLQPFEARPSFEKTLLFIIEATKEFYIETCPICKKLCLPENPSDVITNDTKDDYIERVYCGHIYHQGCLKKYIREPPFLPDGKLCPALKKHPRSDEKKSTNVQKSTSSKKVVSSTCSIRLSHDRWSLTVKMAEARWAQQQARERELEEVVDFLQ